MSVDPKNSPEFGRNVDDWMAAARQGCQQSLGDLLTTCRDYLLLVAEKEIPCDLRAKVGASDLVQETLLAAQRNFVRFEGHEPEQLLRWLRAILILRLADLNRHYRQTRKREVSRETARETSPQGEPYAKVDSPSGIAIRAEAQAGFERALASLPAHYQRVIVLRNLEHRSFVEIAQEIGRSPDATRKLWFRAIACLQQRYGGAPEDE
jgi:RNA polymerase sigma-70 factor, ECF subfamily